MTISSRTKSPILPDSTMAISEVVRNVLAYASGLSIEDISEDIKLDTLGIDSAAMLGAGLLLQAELMIELSNQQVAAIFTARDVTEAVELACAACRSLANGPTQ